jgi:hypothetical protein
VVETLNVLDTGTSVLLDAQVRIDFTAKTALEALADPLQTYGRPQRITLDRDPRLSSAVRRAVTFPPRSCASEGVWASIYTSVIRTIPNRMLLSKARHSHRSRGVPRP